MTGVWGQLLLLLARKGYLKKMWFHSVSKVQQISTFILPNFGFILSFFFFLFFDVRK